ANASRVFHFRRGQSRWSPAADRSSTIPRPLERNPLLLDGFALLARMAGGDDRLSIDFRRARYHGMAPPRKRSTHGRTTLLLPWKVELRRLARITACTGFCAERLPGTCSDRAGRGFVLLDPASHIRSERISLATTHRGRLDFSRHLRDHDSGARLCA